MHDTWIMAYFSTIGAFIALGLTYAGIDIEVFTIFSCLLSVDFVTGVWKAHVLGIPIQSNRAGFGLLSKFTLIIIPIVLALAAKAVGQSMGEMFTWGMYLLVVSETYSIIGNISVIRGGEDVPEWDALSILTGKIRKLFPTEQKRGKDAKDT